MEQHIDAMDRFLASVERRAFCVARIATGDREEALDIVQEAMLNLVRKYRLRPQEEWRALFYRILQSRIRDWRRRIRVRKRFMTWLNLWRDPEDPEREGKLEASEKADGLDPEQEAAQGETHRVLEEALHALPKRQQQAFLLRTWEGLDTQETALAMGCSEGSVKTHYSRAIHALREMLDSRWP